jgi:hypothetical protein
MTMPAWLFILRIGKFPVPLPWFLLWLLLSPFVLLAVIVGTAGRLLGSKAYPIRVMRESWRVLLLITCLHGLLVDVVTGSDQRIRLRFI